MYQDPEINAMNDILEALMGLDKGQIKRIIEWVTDRLLEEKVIIEKPNVPLTQKNITNDHDNNISTSIELDNKRHSRPPNGNEQSFDTSQQFEPAGITGFRKYSTIEDLFFVSNVRTIASKILLVATWLQEKNNFKEFSSFDINSRLKKISQGVQNITNSINSLLSKKPPLLIQTKKQGTSKQAKRKFRVTEEGLRIARNYLSEE